MLTKRLALCAEMVSGKGIACDVGTDHAYLAAELLKKGKCRKVIASDIAEGPINAAKRTLMQAGLLDRAELVLSDGLENIPSEGVSDVVIAGMGGETIAHILEECGWIKNGVKLILQPMSKIPFLRKWLCSNGFGIICEKIAVEGRFFYTVIAAEFDGKEHILSEFEQELGVHDWNDEAARAYGRFRASQLAKLSHQLETAEHTGAEFYKRLLLELLQKIGGEENDNS